MQAAAAASNIVHICTKYLWLLTNDTCVLPTTKHSQVQPTEGRRDIYTLILCANRNNIVSSVWCIHAVRLIHPFVLPSCVVILCGLILFAAQFCRSIVMYVTWVKLRPSNTVVLEIFTLNLILRYSRTYFVCEDFSHA